MEAWTLFKDYDNHRRLVGFSEPSVGLRGFMAIHRHNYSVALGGTRLLQYTNDHEAITDVLRLSRGMGRKSAMADLPLDGGKIVLIGDPGTVKTKEYLRAYGTILRSFAGQFITGEDVNITMDDADTIAETANTTHKDGMESVTIAGLSAKGGDPSPVTARGILYGMRACLAHTFGDTTFNGRTIAIEGIGKVGYPLAEMLIKGGADVILADINPVPMAQLQSRYPGNVRVLEQHEDIYTTTCDIFAPCARGAVLSQQTIPRLQCRIVAGSANNQLAAEGDGNALYSQQIIYAPDYVINAGGLMNVYDEIHPQGYSRTRVMAQVKKIENRIEDILESSARAGIPTNKIANGKANLKIGP